MMKNMQRVVVVDGPLPEGIWERPDMEPQLNTAPELQDVMRELMQREPLFHRPEFGKTRGDFDKMMASGFWEIGASGRRYSRGFVLDVLEERYEKATEDVWQMGDVCCRELGTDNYLFSYTLMQGERVTRRTTIWRRTADGWQAVFHQGTVVS